MAALNRPTFASYVIHEKVTVDTTDHEDHTFSGVMFPIECKSILPVDHVVIDSIAIRGELGPITVWVSRENDDADDADDADDSETMYQKWNVPNPIMSDWEKVYEKTLPASVVEMAEIVLDTPIVIKPGTRRGVYVHSTLLGDESIVYDNQKSRFTYNDTFLTVHPGRAHVSNKVFGTRSIWGWGNPWREHREFVGKINYGVVYRLWDPSEHAAFGPQFRNMALTLLQCQRRLESPVCLLPDECIYYILNLCGWNWSNDGVVVNDHYTSWLGMEPPVPPPEEQDLRGLRNVRRRRGHPVFQNPADVFVRRLQYIHRYVIESDDDVNDVDYYYEDDGDDGDDNEYVFDSESE